MASDFELRDVKHADDQNQQPKVIIVDGSEKVADGAPPKDAYNLVFVILLLHGIGTLMPWNMFINAQDYFRNYKLASHSTNATVDHATMIREAEVQDLRKNFLIYLSFASQLPNVIFNGLNVIVNMGSGNLKLRVNLTLILEAIIFAITIILAKVDSSDWQSTFFYLTMGSVVLLNIASGIYQNCIFGTGAIFPGRYTNAILIGSNLSGTFTSTVNLLSIGMAPEPQVAATYYFITALFVILICILSYNILPYNTFYRYYDNASNQNSSTVERLEIQSGGDDEIGKLQADNMSDIPVSLRKTVDAMVPKAEQYDQNLQSSFSTELRKKWLVFMKCWPQCLNVFFTFYVTLALFPAIMANIQQQQDVFSNKYFISFACFFVFNVFAMIGNLISSLTTWPGKQNVWMFVAIRILFVPFFLLCNFNPNSRHWPVLITNDYIYIIANILLALSSGYLSSVCMMFASSDLEADEAPKAGMLAAFFLVLGIFLGVNSSFILTWIVELG